MHYQRVVVVGAGNMGAALVGGLVQQGYPAGALGVSDPSVEKLAALKEKFGVLVDVSNEEILKSAEAVIFAVKPDAFEEVTRPLAGVIRDRKMLLVSIVTGVREERIQSWLGGGVAIVRAMPNTPALIGCGATGLYANEATSPAQRALAEKLLKSVGLVLWLEHEKEIDAVTALSGSGPAYLFYMLEAMQKAGEALGLTAETARRLALQTGYGASRLALESEESLATLRRRVTSPGGTTEQAIRVLEEGGFEALIAATLRAAHKRSEELANT